MNSASEAGGVAPEPAHSRCPEPQSAVAQVNLPAESKEQDVRAHRRPDHELGIEMEFDWPVSRAKPVVGS